MFKETKLHFKLTFIEPVLGSSPSDEEIYENFVASKLEGAPTLKEEVEAIGVDGVMDKGMTIFPKFPDGAPFFWDYQIRGMFKGSCGFLRKADDATSGKLKAFKKAIDGNIFVEPRKIPVHDYEPMAICQRPLRADTAQGPRTALSISEEIPAGAWVEFDVVLLDASLAEYVREWLEFAKYNGFGQWRNSGKGRLLWEELDDDGNIVNGNTDAAKEILASQKKRKRA